MCFKNIYFKIKNIVAFYTLFMFVQVLGVHMIQIFLYISSHWSHLNI